jgi:hypothetical protein
LENLWLQIGVSKTKGEIIMEELQEGTGALESRWESKDKFDASYSIMFRSDLQPLPAAPSVFLKMSHIVNHIRSVDGREIPDGEYKLTYPTEGTQEYQYLRKNQGIWEVLPQQSQSW